LFALTYPLYAEEKAHWKDACRRAGHLTARALDWLREVLHDANHTAGGVARSIQPEARAHCDRAVLEKPPRR
jgi:hypothetical protein